MSNKSKLSDEDRHAIKILKGCVSYDVIAKKYGISKSTIYNIQNEKAKEIVARSNKNYYHRNKEKFLNYSRNRRNKSYYGLEDVSELKPMQIWESEMGRVLVLEGDRGRLNLYDSQGVLRNKWKLIEKVCDIKELFKK